MPAVRASKLAVPHMKRRGGGVILMIASIFGRETGGRMTYNAVKAAEISLAKSLAQQLARDNIRVNSVAPGSILFPGGSWWKRQQADPEGIAEFVEARTAVRPFRHARGGCGRRGVPGIVAGGVGQRRQHRRRWLPVEVAVLDDTPPTALGQRAVGGRGAFHLRAGRTGEGHPSTDGNGADRTRSPRCPAPHRRSIPGRVVDDRTTGLRGRRLHLRPRGAPAAPHQAQALLPLPGRALHRGARRRGAAPHAAHALANWASTTAPR